MLAVILSAAKTTPQGESRIHACMDMTEPQGEGLCPIQSMFSSRSNWMLRIFDSQHDAKHPAVTPHLLRGHLTHFPKILIESSRPL